MAAPTVEHSTPVTAEPPWAQTSFLAEEVSATLATSEPSVVAEALAAADHAVDRSGRRAALDRLSAHLAHRALRRGRAPVPKRAT